MIFIAFVAMATNFWRYYYCQLPVIISLETYIAVLDEFSASWIFIVLENNLTSVVSVSDVYVPGARTAFTWHFFYLYGVYCLDRLSMRPFNFTWIWRQVTSIYILAYYKIVLVRTRQKCLFIKRSWGVNG